MSTPPDVHAQAPNPEPRKCADWIESYMKMTEETEPPVLFRKWCAVHAIAACLERKCWLKWQQFQFFYPNFYIMLVADSGLRKGTAMAPIRAMMKEVKGLKLASESITREALIQELEQSIGQFVNPVNGKTIQHCSLTVSANELAVFLGYNNFQMIQDLTDWFDCDSEWKYRTKTQGIATIQGMCFNMLGGITPALLAEHLPKTAHSGGFTSRVIMVYAAKRAKLVPFPFTNDELDSLREDLTFDLQQIHRMRGEFRVTDNFCVAYNDFYTETHENPPFYTDNLKGYCSRRPLHVLKLSMIMNASRGGDMKLSRHDIDAAIELLTETERRMPYAFYGCKPASPYEISRHIMATLIPRGTMTLAELTQSLIRYVPTAYQMNELLQQLRTSGLIELYVNAGKQWVRCLSTEQLP